MQPRRIVSVVRRSLLMLAFVSPAAWSDLAYVANEQSVTVSVIDTATNSVVATIGLGSDPAIAGTPQPNGPFNGEADHHRPFYNGHVDPHGLWLTPDGAILLVANRISGTIVAIDTATRRVLGYTPVGREPHLATVHPNGREAWVAVRGENYLDVLKLDRDDLYKPGLRRTARMEIVATIDTMLGPSMVSFTSDGQYAFVASGKEAVVQKIHASTRRALASAPVAAPFTPFGLVTPDDRELYLVHKGAGLLSIHRTSDLGLAVPSISVGARPNHVFFVGNLAYVTVGGPAPSAADPDPEGKIVIIDRTTHSLVNTLTGAAFKGEPHAVWGTSHGTLLVGHERGNKVTVLQLNDPANPFDDVVGTTITDASMRRLIDIVVAR